MLSVLALFLSLCLSPDYSQKLTVALLFNTVHYSSFTNTVSLSLSNCVYLCSVSFTFLFLGFDDALCNEKSFYPLVISIVTINLNTHDMTY